MSTICKRPWTVVAACFISIMIWMINYVSYSSILPFIKGDLGLTYTEVGLIASSFVIGYAVGQIPWGHFADKFGSRIVITVGLVGLSLTTIMFGISNNIIEITIWRIAAGFLGAAIFVPSVKIISGCFFKERRSLAIAIFTIGANVGGIIIPLVALSLGLEVGWRLSISLIALMSLLGIIPVWLLLKQAKVKKTLKRRVKFTEFLRRVDFWILGYAHFVRLGIIFTIISWMPTFMFEARNFDAISAGFSIPVISIVGALAVVIGGLLSRKVENKRIIISSFIALAPVFYLFSVSGEPELTWTLVVLSGILSALYMGPMWTISSLKAPVGQEGVISGYYNTIGATGGLAMPLILGYAKDLTGFFAPGWFVIATFCGLAAVLTIFLRK
ncbi:MAG: MFS transporter [Candidatus Bathyarchaeota archaeon]